MKSKNLILWDLDSTLINTNEVFEMAQKKLITSLSKELKGLGIEINDNDMEEMDLLRKMDYEGIKIRKHAGYDFPYQLPLSLIGSYLERSDLDKNYRIAWLSNKGVEISEREGKNYVKDLERIPRKFENIEDVLLSSNDNYNVLFTEYFEDVKKQKMKVTSNGLEKYFDKIIMTERKDAISIASAIECAKLENGINNLEELTIIYIDDRSKYLEIAKKVFPSCYTVNVLFGEKEIFMENFGSVDYVARNVNELKNFIQTIKK